jgi:hypothetical protein
MLPAEPDAEFPSSELRPDAGFGIVEGLPVAAGVSTRV